LSGNEQSILRHDESMTAGISWIKSPPSGVRRLLMFSFSALCHWVAFIYVLGFYKNDGQVLLQLQVLVIASFICAGAALLFRSRTVLVYAHGFRMFLIILPVAILGGKNLVAELLFVVPFMVEITDRFHWIVGIVVSAANILTFLFLDLHSLIPGDPGMAIPQATILVVVLVPISVMSGILSRGSDVLEEKKKRINDLLRAVEHLTSANKAFQDYAEMIKSISTEQERNRITRELHDLTGYALTNIIMLMNAGRVFLRENPEKLEDVLDNTKKQADSALTETRRILYQLRAMRTPGPTGLHAIYQLVRAFSEATNVHVNVNYGNLPMTCGEEVDGVIYSIIQEGLTNALTHGKAQKITVSLMQTETEIIVSVGDNGAGAGEISEGIGLKGIRERLSLLGGSLNAHNLWYGFELVARIPMDRRLLYKEAEDGPHKDTDR
jgi:signal transduction histidine kinase